MMIPLIVQANPINCISPVVYLSAGTWVIKSNHKQSKIVMYTPTGSFPLEGDIAINGDTIIKFEFTDPKNERITIEAHKCL